MNVKPIPGFPGYEISDCGRVFSWKKIGRYPGKLSEPRELKQQLNKTIGYVQVILFQDKKAKCLYVHRLVLEAFEGPCPENYVACHNDGNPENNNLSNLRWDSVVNNNKDKIKHGTSNNKLNENEVLMIRQLHHDKLLNMKQLAKKFEMSISRIHDIIHRKCWKHI